jgi:hypothetical protein
MFQPIKIGGDQLMPAFPKISNGRMAEIGDRSVVTKAMSLGPEFREDPASSSADEQACQQ